MQFLKLYTGDVGEHGAHTEVGERYSGVLLPVFLAQTQAHQAENFEHLTFLDR